MRLRSKYKNSKKQGDAALGIAIAWFVVNKYTVSLPLTDSQDYDLIVDKNNKISKVAVRSTVFKTKYGIYQANLTVKGGNQSWNKTAKFLKDFKIQLLFIATKSGTKYLIPISKLKNSTTINLNKQYDKYKV